MSRVRFLAQWFTLSPRSASIIFFIPWQRKLTWHFPRFSNARLCLEYAFGLDSIFFFRFLIFIIAHAQDNILFLMQQVCILVCLNPVNLCAFFVSARTLSVPPTNMSPVQRFETESSHTFQETWSPWRKGFYEGCIGVYVKAFREAMSNTKLSN